MVGCCTLTRIQTQSRAVGAVTQVCTQVLSSVTHTQRQRHTDGLSHAWRRASRVVLHVCEQRCCVYDSVTHVLHRTGFHVFHMDDSITDVLHVRQQHHTVRM